MTTPRTVLVTGGNRGIGRAIAEEFIARGHRVAVTARNGDGPAGSLTVRADVTDTEQVDAAGRDVLADLTRLDRVTLVPQLVEQLGVHQVHLSQVRLRRVLRDP